MSPARHVIATVIAAAALLLAGCTTESQVCKNGVCKISMSGKGATAQLGGKGGSTIVLVSAGGDQAVVKIAGQQGTLYLKKPLQLDNGTLTLTEVKDNKIKLEVTGESGSSGGGGTSTTPADASGTS